MVDVKRRRESELIRLYGEVTSCDDSGKVTVEFGEFEAGGFSEEDFTPEANSYLTREIATHATDMDWENDEEWNFHFDAE